MNIFDMTKEDFEKVPKRCGFSEDIGEFDSLVIIPQDYARDSGWLSEHNGVFSVTHWMPLPQPPKEE